MIAMAEEQPARRLPLPIPVILGAVVLAIFLPWVLLTGKSERDARRALETYDPFALPPFPLNFSKTIQFDPLGFLGKGMQAGFWQWTETGMVLAEKGRAYFTETPDQIMSVAGAGRRSITSLQGYQDRNGKRELRFRYRWAAITPPASQLLSRPPRLDFEYDGRAILTKQNGGWRVERLETPDFDKMLALLLDTAQGTQR